MSTSTVLLAVLAGCPTTSTDTDDPQTDTITDTDTDTGTDGPTDAPTGTTGDTGVDCDEGTDFDADGVVDQCDNCPFAVNADQADADADGFGDVCSCDDEIVTCQGGTASGFPCDDIDLAAHVDLGEIGTYLANDIWGWVDPVSGREIAILGTEASTIFFDLYNPACPDVVGTLPGSGQPSLWRDLETYGSFAYVVSEGDGHGAQVFDLRELPLAGPQSAVLEAHHTYDDFTAHTVSIDTETGLFVANDTDDCERGLHVATLDATTGEPTFAGCYPMTGAAHDAQCTVYRGPDTDYTGTPICIVAMGFEGSIRILDMSDPSKISEIEALFYGPMSKAMGGEGAVVSHQGWLTADHRTFIFGDEYDEFQLGNRTTTFLFDFSDLDAPTLIGEHVASTTSIDHQQHVHDGHVYQSNYTAGLRILDAAQAHEGTLSEVAHFDVYPDDDSRQFLGTWSNYPWYPSGIVAVSSIDGGLFVLAPQL
ncbi:MAG: choice-of-anchor B family protein [Myxococcales bacterium]|nr:choice-of-anchor B family protein [Myxococcales bacterium]